MSVIKGIRSIFKTCHWALVLNHLGARIVTNGKPLTNIITWVCLVPFQLQSRMELILGKRVLSNCDAKRLGMAGPAVQFQSCCIPIRPCRLFFIPIRPCLISMSVVTAGAVRTPPVARAIPAGSCCPGTGRGWLYSRWSG